MVGESCDVRSIIEIYRLVSGMYGIWSYVSRGGRSRSSRSLLLDVNDAVGGFGEVERLSMIADARPIGPLPFIPILEFLESQLELLVSGF
jgi:hypothetical protein